ncbi:alpha/beta hydrolase [Demequina sp. NBRC 110055]|uniref:alpha/beta hydrolase n=1 Tax=Demequina sp. NBRC 110055 TaxID=1570344 RepID=UPI0009FC1D45|nr:alpha/beta fold hydrolase [Demequina sp. NBRC 110055]
MSPASAALPPIVLIHGLWMTPSSWNTWAERFRARGHVVYVPGWPGIDDRTPAEVRADPSSLRGRSIGEIVDHYDAFVRGLDSPPIIMGHSFGGLFAQMLLDRGLGVAGVGVEPGQPAGVLTLPWPTLKSGLPVLSNPFGKGGAKPLTPAHFHYTFGNDLTREESDREFEANGVPAVNQVFFEGVLSLPRTRSGVTAIDFAKPDRAPLLIISGEIDHVVPAAIHRTLVKKYAAGPALVEHIEYPGRTHRIISQEGWEEVADHALDWAMAHAVAPGQRSAAA